MVIYFSVSLKDLFTQGRDYPWPMPRRCPRCGSCRLWGHGYVSAYFDDYDQAFQLKRYRCPECGCVIRLRPHGYFPRFQAPAATIRQSIVAKATKGKWLAGISRSRQGHWLRALLRKLRAYLTDSWTRGMAAGFDYLIFKGHIPVSRSI